MTLKLNLDAIRNPRIEGRRIYLRRMNAADVSPDYLDWINSTEINRYLESRFYEHTMESLHEFVTATSRDPYTLLTGIFLRDGHKHIGNIKLGPIDPHHGHADMGLLIGDRTFWRKGYATEAIGVLSEFGFNVVRLHRITAGAYSQNEASSRAFERNGFAREGILRSHWLLDGKFQDGIILAKVNPKDVSG